MSPTLIDLNEPRGPSSEDLPGLFAYLALLVGENFKFARVSYGDEGSYILGLRGSPWVLKSGPDSEPLVLTAGVMLDPPTPAFGQPLSNEELESRRVIEPESRVTAAIPFVVKQAGTFGLQLRLSDGSSLLVLPSPQSPDEMEGDGDLPELADWELSSPRGLLRAGPGLKWDFRPR